MKAARPGKLRRQEDQASFVSWRFALLCGCILLAMVGLMLRVAYLQVINPDRLVKEGDMRSLRVQEVPTARGMISDRAGRPLAVSVPVNAVWADPKELNERGGITLDSRWKALSDALNIPLDQLSNRINANPKGRFVYLARQVNPAIGDYIHKPAAGDLPAAGVAPVLPGGAGNVAHHRRNQHRRTRYRRCREEFRPLADRATGRENGA